MHTDTYRPMARHPAPSDGMTEPCEQCGDETLHDVAVELRTENAETENARFSREPYRVSECRDCGATRTRRMNDA